jgi:hypothetical protein
MNDSEPFELTRETNFIPFDCPSKNLTFFPRRPYNPAIKIRNGTENFTGR